MCPVPSFSFLLGRGRGEGVPSTMQYFIIVDQSPIIIYFCDGQLREEPVYGQLWWHTLAKA